MEIKEFLDKKPTLTEILDYVESQAQKIAAERQAANNIRGKSYSQTDQLSCGRR